MEIANDNAALGSSVLQFKARPLAPRFHRPADRFDSVQEFCDRLNSLQSKSDIELHKMGLSRKEIGAHVLQRLLN